MKKEVKEQWKDIPNYEGYYQVSNIGRIRSLDRIVGARSKGYKRIRGILLKQRNNSHGIPYYYVNLWKKRIMRHCLVHRLVAITWLGPIPEGMQVRHGPNGYTDNSVNNLCYGTRQDDALDRVRDGTVYKVPVKRSDGAEFSSIREAAKKTGCRESHISTVCRGRERTAGGYGWFYIID